MSMSTEYAKAEAEAINAFIRWLSFRVPTGYRLMEKAEIDRIQNEAEALRIERDAARAELFECLKWTGADVSDMDDSPRYLQPGEVAAAVKDAEGREASAWVDQAEEVSRLRLAAGEALIALASLLLADETSDREDGLQVHSPEMREQIRQAHDLIFAALHPKPEQEPEGAEHESD